MPKLTTPYPLPDAALPAMQPALLAEAAAATLRQAYGVELDFTPASLERLDAVMREQFRLGHYRRESFPNVLALVIGVYLAEVLRRAVPDGRWGEADEDLYSTPLPFLLFTRGEYARQLNVVEDVMRGMWDGNGPTLPEMYALHLDDLRRLGFVANPAGLTPCSKQ